MRLDIQSLQTLRLFKGIEAADLPAVMRTLDARAKAYGPGEAVMLAGDAAGWMGIVLQGAVQVFMPDYRGYPYLVGQAGEGDIFGESFNCAGAGTVPVDAVAVAPSEVLLVRWQPDFALRGEDYMRRLTANLIYSLGQKNVYLNDKLNIVTRRTTREKLMAYLHTVAEKAGKNSFTVPLSRQQLADTLGVERSAMSAELSRMARDGLIDYSRNDFTLL